MSRVLVDSNVILDLFTEDPVWCDWSSATLAEWGDHANLVINPVIYSEISIRFESIEALEEALGLAMFERETIPWEAAFLAGKAFLAYRRRGGVRSSPSPDFFIGAHAAIHRLPLITRNPIRYQRNFPTVRLISPQS